MLNTKDKVIITISILLVLASILLVVNFNNKSPKKIEKQTETKEKDTKKELTDEEKKQIQQEDKVTSMELLNKLKNESNYELIENDNSSFYDKYRSLELIIYYANVYSYYDISNDAIMASIFNNTNMSDISNVKKEDNNVSGFVKKEYIKKKIKTLYNTDQIRVKINNNSEERGYSYDFITISGKEYRYVYIVDEDKDNYQIKIIDNYGTYVSPRTYPFPMKITEVKKYDDYLLVISKAVYLGTYSSREEQWFKDEKWILPVCNYDDHSMCSNEIGKTTVEVGPFATVNIDNYIEKASTIYTIFKKENDNYYFYRNFIDN